MFRRDRAQGPGPRRGDRRLSRLSLVARADVLPRGPPRRGPVRHALDRARRSDLVVNASSPLSTTTDQATQNESTRRPEGATMDNDFDAIIVGARCAGAPTAMLLAQQGLSGPRRRSGARSRATPSPPIVIHAPGVAALRPLGAARRGDRDRLPADRDILVRLRAVRDRRARRTGRRHPRRVRAAPHRARQDPRRRRRRAGAEVREGFIVEEHRRRGRRVVGIRGHARRRPSVDRASARSSSAPTGATRCVAKAVGARAVQRQAGARGRVLHATGAASASTAFETVIRPHRGFAAHPHQRRPDARRRRLAVRRGRATTRPTSRATTSRPSTARPSSPSGFAPPRA